MKKKLAVLTLCLVPLVALADVVLRSGSSSDTVTVNAAKSLLMVRGASTVPTYTCTATGLVSTAAYSLNLQAEVARGFKIQKVSLASAKAMYPASSGDELLRHALAVFRELDLSEDGQRDYSDRQAGLYLRAAAAEVAHGNG
jgi:hypothetical protein